MPGRNKQSSTAGKQPKKAQTPSNKNENNAASSTARDGRRAKGMPLATSSKSSAPQSKAEDSAVPINEPKKPDTRTLIGGESWTGKLPVNLLSEHCQKQRWEKPNYSMVRPSNAEQS